MVNEATASPTTATTRAAATNQTSNQDLNLNTTQMSFIVRNDRNLPCNSRHYVEGAQTHYSATNRPSAPSTAAATNDTVPSSTTSARSSSVFFFKYYYCKIYCAILLEIYFRPALNLIIDYYIDLF